MKASTRRRRTPSGDLAEGWLLSRPAFGFGSDSVSSHPSWKEARDSLLAAAPASGAQVTSVQVAGYVPGLRGGGWQVRRPRWIESGGGVL